MSTYPSPMQRSLNRHATTIMIGGVFLSTSVVLYLSLCNFTCDHRSYIHDHPSEMLRRRRKSGPLTQHTQDQFVNPLLQPGRPLKNFLTILIFSSIKNFQRRTAMRNTWLKSASHFTSDKDGLGIRHLFAIGTSDADPSEIKTLDYEFSQHGDLLMLPHVKDSYNTLTAKLLESLVWLDQHVDQYYVFKVDDDTFARLDVIVRELHQHHANHYVNTRSEADSSLYWGFFDGRATVQRKGQWAESKWNLCDKYLPHARGGGYIISADLVHYVAAGASYWQKWNSEDISLGAWLAPLNIHRRHDPRFNTEHASRGCHNDYIVMHKQTTAEMQQLQENLKSDRQLCKQPIRLRYSYIYNWDVPPSLCCIRNNTSVP